MWLESFDLRAGEGEKDTGTNLAKLELETVSEIEIRWRVETMMGMMGMLGFAAAMVGSLAMSVTAGFLLLKGAMRMMESAVQPEAVMGDVTDISEYIRRTTDQLEVSNVERAA